MISPHWYGQHYGGAWTLDSGILFDTGYPLDTTDWVSLTAGAATSLTVTNNGNRTVTNAVVTVAAGTANITATQDRRDRYQRVGVCGHDQRRPGAGR